MAGSPLRAVTGLANMLVSSSTLLFRVDRIRFQDLKSGPFFGQQGTTAHTLSIFI